MEAKQGSRESTGRSIDRILARRRRRKRRRVFTRAPDVLHGDCRVDAIYEVFGPEWVESTAFAEPIVGRRGTELGWTVAQFDERFLRVTQGIAAEIGDMDAWVGARLEGCRRAVVLDLAETDEPVRLSVGAETTVIETTRGRLRALEREYLRAARDRTFGRPPRKGEVLDERLLQSRVDVRSLICLCARLI